MNEQNADWLCRRIEKESHFFEERRSTPPKGTRFVEIEVSSRDAGGTRCLSAVHGEDRDAVVERIDDARFWSR